VTALPPHNGQHWTAEVTKRVHRDGGMLQQVAVPQRRVTHERID
jgi:fumarate hydratase class II